MTTDNQGNLPGEHDPQNEALQEPKTETLAQGAQSPENAPTEPTGGIHINSDYTHSPSEQGGVGSGNLPPTQNQNYDASSYNLDNSQGATMAKAKQPNAAAIVSVSGATVTTVAIVMFYLSLAIANPIPAGLILLLSSIMLLVSVVLLVWGAFLAGKDLIANRESKTSSVLSIIAAVLLTPLALFFTGIGFIASVASWFAGYF